MYLLIAYLPTEKYKWGVQYFFLYSFYLHFVPVRFSSVFLGNTASSQKVLLGVNSNSALCWPVSHHSVVVYFPITVHHQVVFFFFHFRLILLSLFYLVYSKLKKKKTATKWPSNCPVHLRTYSRLRFDYLF